MEPAGVLLPGSPATKRENRRGRVPKMPRCRGTGLGVLGGGRTACPQESVPDVRGDVMAATEIRNVRLPTELWARYVERADELEYRSVGELVREALTFYDQHILRKMERGLA